MLKKTKTYYTQTFGCKMNELDSEKIAGLMESKGYILAENKYNADTVIINTCSVRQSAEDRVMGMVENLKKLKPKPKIITTGCMVSSAEGKR